MTPAADDDKTAFTPRDTPAQGGGPAPTNFAPTAPVERTQITLPPSAKLPDMGNGLPVGTRIGEFEITSLLGEGGFGIVYLANDTSLGRRVALKEYMPSSLAARTADSGVQVKSDRHRETFEAGRKSFVNEARLLAQFDHPSLVKVYRFWESNGTAYMVMPFYEGKTLKDTLRELRAATGGAPDEAWLRTLLLPLSEALRVIHVEQCYHRDIAPDNVILLAGSQRPLLLDFGAARRVIGDMTQALTVILKPGYAPVEQYAEVPGMRQGPWTDIYALAAVVYFAITGKTPPVSVGRMLNDNFQPLAQVAAGRYSARFLEAVDRGLLVRPEQRPQSIEEFREDLGLMEPLDAVEATVVRPALAPDITLIAPSTKLRAGAAANAATRQMPAQPRAQTLMPTPAPTAPPRLAPLPTPMGEGAVATQRPAQQPASPGRRAAGAARAEQQAAADEGAEQTGRRGLVIGLASAAVAALGIGGFMMSRRSGGTDTNVGGTAPVPAPPARVAPSPASAPAATPAAGPSTTTASAPTPVAPAPPATSAAPASFDAVREFDKAVQAQTAVFGLRASAPKTALRIGRDELRFSLRSEREGHLYVLGFGPDGGLAQLVPNRLSGPVRLRAGQSFDFPAKDNFMLVTSEPAGTSHLLVIVSAEPRNFDALSPKAEGDVRLFATGEPAAAAVARHAGAGSVVAGRAQCPTGAATCDQSYGAALLKFEAVR